MVSLCLISFASLSITQAAVQAPLQRTIIDTELGAIFTQPNGFTWGDYGAYVGVFSTYSSSTLNPNSIQANFTRFHEFGKSDDTGWNYFPYSKFASYEASEIAAGRPPLFVTATYQGKRRPVYWLWSLELNSNNSPTASPNSWRRAVNVGDDRFIKFWLNQYLRPVLWQNMYAVQNLWWSLDECAFNYGVYGVIDDSNHFVAGVTWDQPFPQNSIEYDNSIARFFNRLKAFAPDVKTMPLIGTMDNPDAFQKMFADVPALEHENMYDGLNPSAYLRNARFPEFTNIAWFGAQDRIGILRSMIPEGDPVAMCTALVIYDLLKGPNFFFAPAIDGTGTSIDPATYKGMVDKIGNPIEAFQSTQEPGKSVGYRFYSRQYDAGIVYLNWTGSSKTVHLPNDHWYFDPNGNYVTDISIPDGVGTFVTVNSYQTTTQPRISPRFGSPVVGPVTVSIECDIPGAAIRYTLDGSTPNSSSPMYTGPITLNNSATVKASAIRGGYGYSSVATAKYTVVPNAPSVQFATTSDSGPAGTAYAVLSADAVSMQSMSVGYTVTQPNGSKTQATATFAPGELYHYIAIPVSGASKAVVRVAITSIVNANYALNKQFSYTIN